MKDPSDLRLMLVTDPAMTRERGLEATVLAAVAGGVTIVQLRDKTAADADLIAMGRALKAALAASGVPLIVDDRPEVAHAIGAAGVHLGQDDGDPAAARQLLGPDAIIGWSVTHRDQVVALVWQPVDYIGLGPIFATASKPDAAPALGLDAIRFFRQRTPLPIVAIGGVDAANAGAIMAAGASGAAVISAICGAPDPRRAAEHLRAAIDGIASRASR